MKNKPNILLILSDQQRTDTLGFIGKTPCRTPNLDRLATEGISFDQNITPCPLCLPARASIFSGMYPHQIGTMSLSDKLERTPPLLEKLREEGYQIDNAGKLHMGEGDNCNWVDRWIGNGTKDYTKWCLDNGLPDGWTFNDLNMRSHRPPNMSIPLTAILDLKPEQTNDAWITDHAINLLKTRKKDQPFFLTCAFNGPHPPFKIPEPSYIRKDQPTTDSLSPAPPTSRLASPLSCPILYIL
jgi:arylsulfatase A-like enzyme